MNCAEKKIFIIKCLLSGHMNVAALFKVFNFALAFFHILLTCSSSVNSLSILTPLTPFDNSLNSKFDDLSSEAAAVLILSLLT